MHEFNQFLISEEAYESLERDSDKLGEIRVVQDPDVDRVSIVEHDGEEVARFATSTDEAPVIEYNDEKVAHIATDHIWVTDGGDVFKKRESKTEANISEDMFSIAGEGFDVETRLARMYGAEFENQRHDEHQSARLRFIINIDVDFPDEFAEKFPVRIDPETP